MRELLRRRLGGLPFAYWVVLVGSFVNRLGTFVQPFLVLYLVRERGMSESAAGVLVALNGAAGVPSQIVGGILADRIGRRQTMLLGTFAFAGALGVLALAGSLPVLVLGVVLTGATADLYRPASSALVADVVPAADRVRAYGLHFWVINLAFAAATAGAGLLAERGYGLLFGIDALTTVVFGLLVYRLVGETRPDHGAHPTPGSFADPFRDRLMLGVITSWFLYTCVYFQGFITLPLTMVADGLDVKVFGFVIGLNGVVIVLVQPLLLGVIIRLPRVQTSAWSIALVGVGFWLHRFADTGFEHAACVVVWTIGEIGTSSIGSALVADIAPQHLRGRYNGAFGFAFGAAAVVAPIAGTVTLERLGSAAVWNGCLAVGALGALAQLALTRGIAERTAVVEPAAGALP
ncbi:MAG TPA: MFS transporter [Mycobacteriales bacterium]|nr:MFS transporter [Mycobacteriales bacterium]